MVERVQAVTPTRSVRYDRERPLREREGFAESGGGRSFERQLNKAMKKRRATEDKRSASEAYVLDVTLPTQSFFYDRQISLERLGFDAYEK